MKFPSGIVAACNTTYGANMEGYYRVYGSKGWLEVDPAFNYDGVHLRGDFGGTHIDELNPAQDPSHFVAEAAHFSPTLLKEPNPEPAAKKASATCAASRKSIAQRGSRSRSLL